MKPQTKTVLQNLTMYGSILAGCIFLWYLAFQAIFWMEPRISDFVSGLFS